MATKRERDKEQQAVAQQGTEQQGVSAASAPEAPAATDKPVQLIYIGPSIRKNGVVVRTNQVFLGGHPAYLKPLYTDYPHIRALFVPVDTLQDSLKQIRMTGTALNHAALSMKGV
ncbi:hypothetical protein JJQ72_06260 [Paenibacillus sp. F411]|uniref:hypothetical protein n=1 Tax=Paenibacillus sp. F411 TaxID=2820239 RepID=UPI001AAFCC6D|nr:hypothetical protein [Paenibacillus sp. F411]MBO2943580.1 hypothetical protein [Paenibacillus sp. F411]